MSETQTNSGPVLSEKMQKQINDQFIIECNNYIKKYTSALQQCSSNIDPTIPSTLNQAIAALKNTVECLQNGTKKIDELRRFKIQVAIPTAIDPQPISIFCRLDQNYSSKSMDVNSFVEIIPPVGEKYKAPRVIEKNCIYNYTHEFKVGPKTTQNYAMLKACDFKFKIYYIPHAVSTPEPILVGQASLGLGPLQFTSSITQKLEFTKEDGSDSGFVFDCKLTMNHPLVPDDGINIDDIIRVFSI